MEAAIEAQRDLYYTGLEHLTPGKPFAEFMDFVNGFGEKRGLKSLMSMHGRGYGDDGPLFTPQNRGARNRDVQIEKGNVFIVKPIVTSADGGFDTSWGGCVLVTDKGRRAAGQAHTGNGFDYIEMTVSRFESRCLAVFNSSTQNARLETEGATFMPWTTPPGAGATVFIWAGYSLAERDRRWQAVRENAGKAGFDCILVPLGNGVDGRYMTQLRCSAMVLPDRRPRANHYRRPQIE